MPRMGTIEMVCLWIIIFMFHEGRNQVSSRKKNLVVPE